MESVNETEAQDRIMQGNRIIKILDEIEATWKQDVLS